MSQLPGVSPSNASRTHPPTRKDCWSSGVSLRMARSSGGTTESRFAISHFYARDGKNPRGRARRAWKEGAVDFHFQAVQGYPDSMNKRSIWGAAIFLGAGVTSGLAADAADFSRDIKPILETACIRCHGAEKPKGELRLDNRAGALKGGDKGTSL